jgi:hypothetical protein
VSLDIFRSVNPGQYYRNEWKLLFMQPTLVKCQPLFKCHYIEKSRVIDWYPLSITNMDAKCTHKNIPCTNSELLQA